MAKLRWTESEILIIQSNYFGLDWDSLKSLLPGRTFNQIRGKAYTLGLRRKKLSKEELAEHKRLAMAAYRDTPDGYQRQLESQREYYRTKGKIKQKEYLNDIKANDFFKWRALRSWGGVRFTTIELKEKWDSQNGLCALTGRVLDKTAQFDHIIPQAKNGSHNLSNLRWVTSEANRAKRDMLDSEFYKLCQDVIKTIGGGRVVSGATRGIRCSGRAE